MPNNEIPELIEMSDDIPESIRFGSAEYHQLNDINIREWYSRNNNLGININRTHNTFYNFDTNFTNLFESNLYCSKCEKKIHSHNYIRLICGHFYHNKCKPNLPINKIECMECKKCLPQ
jgi:hypothetical protein